jgi:heme-degrading monooxygenase HmoA
MLSLFMRKFHKIAAIALLILVVIGMPNTAQAETGISLDTTNEVINVITVYPTTSNQAKVLSEVSQAGPTFSKTPGFQDSAILKAQDGTQVIALSQWQGKLSSFQSYAKEHLLNVSTQTPQTFACQVQHTETRTTSPSFNQGDVIMLSQFKMKPGQDQSELATIVTQEMPSVLQMIPGLQWAAMCPSTDQSTIALLARWNNREDFESLGQQPGFDKETNYWQTYADNEHGLYDVVKIIH